MQKQKGVFWTGLSISLVAALFALSFETLSLFAQEPLPTDTTTLPPPVTDPPTLTDTATATLIDTPAATASPILTDTATPTDTFSPTSTDTALPTDTDMPSFTPVQPTATLSPTLPATMPPASPTSAVPDGPLVLVSESAEIETGWWGFGGTWGRTNLTTAHSGTWYFSDSPGSLYAANTVSVLSLTQPLSLPPGTQIQLQYWQWLDLTSGDDAQVQVSADNTNWITVASENAVRNMAWTVHTVRLDRFAGQILWLRFVLSTDSDPVTVGEGWQLDDITVQAVPLPVTLRPGLTIQDNDDATLWLPEGNWQAVTAPVHSGGLAWTTGLTPDTATALTLNTDVNLAGLTAPELRFWYILDLPPGSDTAQLQLSTDGGQTWLPLATFTSANNAAAWNEQVISLAAYAAQSVRVRFLLVVGNDSPHGSGWSVDTITLQSSAGQPPTASPVPATPVPVTATLVFTPTPEDVKWNTYADTDPLLRYGSGDWQTFQVSRATGGDLTGTADPGATLTVLFTGTGVRVVYSKGPEGRTFTGRVDSGAVQTMDGYGDAYSYGFILAFENLPDGVHTLTVTNGDGALWIEALQIQGTLLDPSESEAGKPAATPTPGYTPTPARESLQVQPIAPLEAQRLQTTTIPVANVTELINAVASSNGNCGVHTIIEMTQGLYGLTAPTDTAFYGNNGLKVNCTLTINGNGSTITRNSGTNFRIFGVDSGANLTLNNVTIHNGWATATGGGGILSVFGTINISQSSIISNTVAVSSGFQILGGGVYSYNGTLTIEESEIHDNSNNSTVGDGGGIGVIAGTANITRSDIRNNSTTRDGGGVAMLFMSTTTAILNDSDIVGNNRISVFANWGADAKKNWWGSSQGPLDTYSTGTRDSVSTSVEYIPFKILVVTAFPGVTQETLDMKAVAGESGLYIHNGPTLNARRQPESAVTWGDKINALARLEFSQEGQSSQVWYQIETAEDETGWIAARIEDKFYIDEVTANSDPCQGKIPDGSDLTFIYNRQAASDYAVLQSIENNVSAPAPYKVSRRIENLPYAHFDYDALGMGTGSAVFVSESIWMGGLPMTVGDLASCTENGPGLLNLGWRYCDRLDPEPPEEELYGLSSPPWDFHESLAEYFTDAVLAPGWSPPNTIISSVDKGSQVTFSSPILNDDRLTPDDFIGILNVSGGGDSVFDQNAISLKVRDALGLVDNEALIHYGDYMWINPQNEDYHGLVIVGWGLTQICSSALANPGPLFANYVAAKEASNLEIPEQDGVAQTVPYVADFVGYYPDLLQSPTPRPFYCTGYDEPDPKSKFAPHDWFFYMLPDSITLSPADIYVNPTWSWTSID